MRKRPPQELTQLRREIIKSAHGPVALDWLDRVPERLPDGRLAPVLVLLHGLLGGYYAPYIQWTLVEAASKGIRCVVVNARGCGGSVLEKPVAFCASDTSAARPAIQHVRDNIDPDARLYVAGFSLGGAVLAKYLCEEGERAKERLTGAVICCTSFDMHKSVHALEESRMGFVYNNIMSRQLRRYVNEHHHVFEPAEWFEMEQLRDARSLREIDTALTVPMFGYRDVAHYYEDATTHHLLEEQVHIPTLILNALDDPILAAAGIPWDACQTNSNLIVACTDEGGHIAWCEGWSAAGRSWGEATLCQYVCALHDCET